MKPTRFVRHVPKTLKEAAAFLRESGHQDGRVLAGGQSLVPIMAFRMAKPAHLADINEVAGLNRLTSVLAPIAARDRERLFRLLKAIC